MHKKPADKFNSCDGVFFPDSFVTVIFHIVSNGIFIHTDDAVVADGNPVPLPCFGYAVIFDQGSPGGQLAGY